MTRAPAAPPHDGVWARLGVSKIHGVGVFALRAIPAGTSVFASDDAPIRWIDRAAIEAADIGEAERALYRDFAIQRADMIGCPADFNRLTVGWYCNEPAPGAEPNLAASPACDMIALRDIAAGEELTLRYAGFSPAPLRPLRHK